MEDAKMNITARIRSNYTILYYPDEHCEYIMNVLCRTDGTAEVSISEESGTKWRIIIRMGIVKIATLFADYIEILKK